MTIEEMETELKRLNDQIAHLATKEELHKELHSLTWKLVGVIISVQIPTWVGIIGILLRK